MSALVVMGVSACGKSTIGALIAEDQGLRFIDGDDLHPLDNVRKMASGVPLSDEDRWPWLTEVGTVLARGGTVVACSALKRKYRSALLEIAPDAVFVHLSGTPEVLANRMAGRSEHFMPKALLESQLATLEPLGDDEPGFVVDIDASIETIVAAAAGRLSNYTTNGAVFE